MKDIQFANPEYFYLFLIIPLLIVWYIFKTKKSYPTFNYPSLRFLNKKIVSPRTKLRHLLFVLRLLALSFAIIALARPQSSSSRENVTTEGIDIVIAMDVSTSMLAEDLKPNRLKAGKANAIKFVNSRVNDRIGLVVFAGESFSQCPITIDHDILKSLIDEQKTGILIDGTSIGNGLATAVSRLKSTDGKSKVIILLTDGSNNSGFIAPKTAAEIAKTFNIRVYTIGIGTRGQAPYPVETPYGKRRMMVDVDLDEPLLRNIADITGGKYFRATSSKALENIYTEIDKMEKTKVDVFVFNKKTEKFLTFLIIALSIFGLEFILKHTIFRTIP